MIDVNELEQLTKDFLRENLDEDGEIKLEYFNVMIDFLKFCCGK